MCQLLCEVLNYHVWFEYWHWVGVRHHGWRTVAYVMKFGSAFENTLALLFYFVIRHIRRCVIHILCCVPYWQAVLRIYPKVPREPGGWRDGSCGKELALSGGRSRVIHVIRLYTSTETFGGLAILRSCSLGISLRWNETFNWAAAAELQKVCLCQIGWCVTVITTTRFLKTSYSWKGFALGKIKKWQWQFCVVFDWITSRIRNKGGARCAHRAHIFAIQVIFKKVKTAASLKVWAKCRVLKYDSWT